MAAPLTVDLDHRLVRSGSQLVDWASRAFQLPKSRVMAADPSEFLSILFNFLLNERVAYKVRELHASEMHPDVRAALEGSNGWKQVLGFHLYRDSESASAYVFFSTANE